MSEYTFPVSVIDTAVALECEADRAAREGFSGVEKRQRAAALHLRNAVEHMQSLCPAGHRTEAVIMLRHVPDVNAVARRYDSGLYTDG